MEKENGRGHISMMGAAFLEVGAMVGAGTAVWLSFLIAGMIAMLQG